MSKTLRKATKLLDDHAGRAEAAFNKLVARLDAVPMHERVQPNVDLQDAGMAAIGVLSHLQPEPIRARLAKLASVGEFDSRAPDDLATLAWAAIHVRRKLLLQLGTSSTAQIPAPLATEASALRARMLALVTYHFQDDVKLGPVVAHLLEGSGHLDTANDLEGCADLYRDHAAVVSADRKHFRPTDEADARRVAQAIYQQLGVGAPSGEHDWTALQPAIWPLLLGAYEQVRRVGRFVYHFDRPDERFPSLISAARSAPSSRDSKTEPTPAAPTPAPAAAR